MIADMARAKPKLRIMTLAKRKPGRQQVTVGDSEPSGFCLSYAAVRNVEQLPSSSELATMCGGFGAIFPPNFRAMHEWLSRLLRIPHIDRFG